MHKDNRHIVQIKWEGPFTLNELTALNNAEIDYGVYQIYGKHPVYGDNALLYIGQANQQTFCTRITQHSYWLEDDFSIYVGRLSGANTPSYDTWYDQIDLAEQLLIYVHTPAYNTMNINSINESKVEHVHVLNFGKYKGLLPEVSGLRWINELDLLSDRLYRYKEEDY